MDHVSDFVGHALEVLPLYALLFGLGYAVLHRKQLVSTRPALAAFAAGWLVLVHVYLIAVTAGLPGRPLLWMPVVCAEAALGCLLLYARRLPQTSHGA